MGIFDFFSRKKKQETGQPASLTKSPRDDYDEDDDWDDEEDKNELPYDPDYLMEKVEVIPGLAMPRAFADHWPALSQTRKETISITATPSENLRIEESTFGHYPRIPVGFDYPKDSDGQFMYPLAQLNMRELPPMHGYPRTGYLQFYIAANDTYGLNFGEKPDDFKVVFFEEQEVEEFVTDFTFLHQTMINNESPVNKPLSLRFALEEEYIGMGTVETKAICGISMESIAAEYDNDLESDLMQFAFDNFCCEGHKIGGFAYFTQTDPREYREAFRDYVLLLQIDSDKNIMWGDVGVGNFFIHPDDLAKKDFSKVMYNWDCS
ncbi:DUF1963 domain-containing protein [Pseudoflavitalea sp. G-6-1-2]|uniref:YwqG family protein n=1 Tax=Pseudoflavitalea sp. G-6-1-2 TaxID=2728841 RepID=UPI00146BE441|nr:DUF1963 domain-containing protein [Pseudoflavitalea sp. G-6-1-2]NML20093.1 DUF1963 domain-containing protein [Pseudoflavitalea sp. G-6-1-2]